MEKTWQKLREMPPKGIPNTRGVVSLLLALILTFAVQRAEADDCVGGAPKEYQVKAAFLTNFTRFIRWPGESKSVKTVCVIGPSPFCDSLVELIEKDDRLSYRRLDSESPIGSCDIAFVSGIVGVKLSRVIDRAQKELVVLVSEISGFIDDGGDIGFITQGNKIRFEINEHRLRSRNIAMSSKLLKLAVRVK